MFLNNSVYFLITLIIVLVIYNLLSTRAVMNFLLFSTKQQALWISCIWLFPFIGSWLANRAMKHKLDNAEAIDASLQLGMVAKSSRELAEDV